jgi:hypothetical protein
MSNDDVIHRLESITRRKIANADFLVQNKGKNKCFLETTSVAAPASFRHSNVFGTSASAGLWSLIFLI